MSNYWAGKRTLVIGGAGFIGYHLVNELVSRGASVMVLDNFSRGGRSHIENIGYTYGDCSDEGTCRDAFRGFTHIFNLAAYVAGVIYNQSNHAEMFTKNLSAQMMPLKIANEYKVERFLNVSSVCVYADDYNSPCVEGNGFKGQPVSANIGYSLAKRNGERLAQWYALEGLHAVSVRPSNVFGPRDYFDDKAHVIPALIRKCFDDKEILVNGTGFEIREFIYVTDVAKGMIAAMEKGGNGQVYNLGTDGGTKISIGALAIRIQRLTGTSDKLVRYSKEYDSGDSVRWSNAGKAEKELDWYYETDLEEGLKRTIEWYRENR